MLRETSIARITVVRHAHHLYGTRDRDHEAGETQREQGERQVAPDPGRPADRLPHEREARIAKGRLAPPEQDRARKDQQRHGHEQ
jgi:hypothetical protein